MPFQWAALAVVVGVLVLLLLAIGAGIGRASERRSRRGGLLELDGPEARAALAGGDVDEDDWFAGDDRRQGFA